MLQNSIQNWLVSLFIPVVACIYSVNFLYGVIGAHWETMLFGVVFGGLTILFSVVYIVNLIYNSRKNKVRNGETVQNVEVKSFTWKSMGMWLLLIVYVVLFYFSNWLFSTIFMLISVMLYLGERRPLILIIATSSIIVVLYILFGAGLGIPFVKWL